MINNREFAIRLKEIMEFYQLSASSFADKIHVQRSSISHLLSGRNKPSLDFVLKVVKEFDEVELYWLLNGKGTFAKTIPTPIATIKKEESVKFKSLVVETKDNSEGQLRTGNNKTIERIVLFYTDGTFKEYLQ